MTYNTAKGNRCKESGPKSIMPRNLVSCSPPTVFDIVAPSYLVYYWLLTLFSIYFVVFVNLWYKPALCFYTFLFVTSTIIDIFRLIRKIFRSCFCEPVLTSQLGDYSARRRPVTFQSMDPYLKEAIQVWCLFESLKDARTKRGMTAAIVQYLQAHVKTSLILDAYRRLSRIDYVTDWSSDTGTSQIEEMLEEAFGSDFLRETQDELILDSQDGSTPWNLVVDQAFSNWKKFRHSDMSKKFTKLINIIVSAGMCSTADLTFKLGNVSLFSPIVTKKQLASGDVFEAFFEAVSGFMKGGWRVFATGEVSAFFTEDGELSSFESQYDRIRGLNGYALTGNLREYTDGEIDENEFDKMLNTAIEHGTALSSKIDRDQKFEKKYVTDRLDKLRDYLTEFTQLRTRGGLRIAPFAVSLFGQSGSGKSSLTNLTVNAGLIYNGYSAEKDRIATWADNDKFASAIRSHINAIIFDDFANTLAQFMDFSPAYRLIQVINNIKYLAPMADVFLKGKVSLNPYFCVVSTNVEHLNAAQYSNEPESVLRRLYHVKVVPLPLYCTDGMLDSTKIRETFGSTPCPDIWVLSIRKYHVQNKRTVNSNAFENVYFEGKEMKDVSVKTYLRWLQITSAIHFKEQTLSIATQDGLPSKCAACSQCYCDCTTALDEQAGTTNLSGCDSLPLTIPDVPVVKMQTHLSTLTPVITRWSDYFRTVVFLAANFVCTRVIDPASVQVHESMASATTASLIASDKLCEFWKRFDLMPESMICHPRVLKFCLLFWRKELKQSLITGCLGILVLTLGLCIQFPQLSVVFLLNLIVCEYWYVCATMRTYQLMISERLLECKDVVASYLNSWQLKYAILGVGAVGIVLAFLRSKHTLEDQTGLEPENMEEIELRNKKPNPWLFNSTKPLPMSAPSKTTTATALADSMRSNLVGIVSEKLQKTTLGFYICSNFVIVPLHFLQKHDTEDISIKCYRSVPDDVGGVFRDKISKSFSVAIPDTDLVICYLTSGGAMKDFRKFLPEDVELSQCAAYLVTRGITDDEGAKHLTLFEGTKTVKTTSRSFIGGYYNLPFETFGGMCMSPLISSSFGSTILGFHLGGKVKRAGCGTITRMQVDEALTLLGQVDGVILSASCGDLDPEMGDFPAETLGCPILLNTDIHSKSATNYLPDGACIDTYGSVAGKATPYSNVVPTFISDAVSAVFGVPQQWGKPQMKGPGVYPYQATLMHAAVPSLPLGSVLAKSVGSYKSLSTDLKKLIPDLFIAEPLSRVATVSGLKGVRFIDPMNFNTSPGFPLSGSKKPLLVDLEPEDYPEIGQPRTFTDEIWDEFDKTTEILRSGERCYVIWKSCLKDESTKLDKTKVRVFQSAPLVLQLLIRMYFLPLVRIIQLNPVLFECAVGVNAEGPEWDELWSAAMSKGSDRVLAGDYSKYDVRMPAQATIAAFDVLIDIAAKCDGYSTEDLHLMRMMVHEVVYPVMAYNGDLIQLFGTNPSGQNLTVIINSVVNSLLLRSCFFTIYPDYDFKEHCAFLTYGDDVIGTVSAAVPKFTHITYADFLSQHDMKFTMPDKESEPTHYMTEADVDFLKRRCVWNEDLGTNVGILSEDSIFKRLHSHLLSKSMTLEVHSANNMASSLHDWFYYGREIFEDRRAKMKEVANMSGIAPLCPELDISYDKRVNRWRHVYLGEDLLEFVNEPDLE